MGGVRAREVRTNDCLGVVGLCDMALKITLTKHLLYSSTHSASYEIA